MRDKPSKRSRIDMAVSPTRPDGVQNVVEHVLFFTIFTDGFQVCEQNGGNPKSYFAVTSRLENCNTYDAMSDIFTRFVTIMAKSEGCQQNLNEILKVMSDVGEEGAYFTINNECHHIRWAIDGICGDVIAEQDINSQSGKLSSVHYCIFGDCQKWRLDPILKEYQQYNSPSTVGKSRFSVEVSPPFIHSCDDDIYSNVSLVANAITTGSYDTVLQYLRDEKIYNTLDGKENSDLRKRTEQELTDLKSLLSELKTDEVLFWKKSMTSIEQNIYHRCKVITEALSLFSMNETISETTPVTSEDQDPIQQKAKELGEWHSSVLKVLGKSDSEKEKEVVVDLDKICAAEKKRRNLIDCMHFIPNFMLRNLQYMWKEVPTATVANELPPLYDYLSVMFLDKNSNINCAKSKLTIPDEVLIHARRRCQQFNEDNESSYLSWVKPDILIPSEFKLLTCERKAIFSLCLFTWIFQDSLGHPYIFALSQILHLIGYQYNWNRDFREAMVTQKKLDFFMGMVESITPPGFCNFSWHLAHHLNDGQVNGGPLKEKDSFFFEHRLGDAKGVAKGGSNPELCMVRNAFREQRVKISDLYVKLKHEKEIKIEDTNEKDMGEYSRLVRSIPWKEMVRANFIDDNEFHRDDTVGHTTLTDVVPYFEEGEEVAAQENVKEWLLTHKPYKQEYSIGEVNAAVYPKIRWFGKVYTSCNPPEGVITYKWLKENEKALGFTRDSKDRILLYAIIGYTLFMVNNLPYVQAVCVPIATRSFSSFVQTQHIVMVDACIGHEAKKVTVMSMFRLHVARGVALCFTSGALGFATMSLVCRQSLFIGHHRLFEHVLKIARDRRRPIGERDKRKNLQRQLQITAENLKRKRRRNGPKQKKEMERREAEMERREAQMKEANKRLDQRKKDIDAREEELNRRERRMDKTEKQKKRRYEAMMKELTDYIDNGCNVSLYQIYTSMSH